MAELTFAEVDALLKYEPETGKLFWKARTPDMFASIPTRTAEHSCSNWNARYAGQEALTNVNAHGYRRGRVGKRYLLAHRVIWLLHTGSWPAGDIDHIDGVRTNNRLQNLRAVTRQQNMRNQKTRSTNTSGAQGVSWDRRQGQWCVNIMVNGKNLHYGYFNDFDAAVARRKLAELQNGFHPNHGRKTA
ncbi:MAG: HNH endonuclease signature motif containing protein [Allorhizobium sp.]